MTVWGWIRGVIIIRNKTDVCLCVITWGFQKRRFEAGKDTTCDEGAGGPNSNEGQKTLGRGEEWETWQVFLATVSWPSLTR